MPAVTPFKTLELSRAGDAKQAILKALGSAPDHFHVFGASVLVATYIEPEKTAGGIFKPQSLINESLWQGSIGLVIKKGPWAFVDKPDLNIFWDGQDVKPGDWAVFRFSSAWEQHLNGVSIRLVDDRDIRGVIDNPELLTSKPLAVTE